MTFTGRLGTPNSKLGNVVLGVVDSFGLGTFGFVVHQIGSRQIRVLFDVPVTDSALLTASYLLSSLASPGTAVVPVIDSVEFFDETRRSVVLNLSISLTSGTQYSLQAFGVQDDIGEGVSSGARNFYANVVDPPIVLGAYLSSRGNVDIVFDRSVGPYSGAATAQIRDAAGGPSVAMTQLTWASELVLPESSLRFSLPPGMPAADAYVIEFADVADASLNTASGDTDLELVLRSPLPYDYTKITQLQIIDAYVADVSNDLINQATIRVYFNGPASDANATINWTATQPGPHLAVDTVDLITAPDAFDSASFIALMNDFKAMYNAHVVAAGIHLRDDTADLVTSPNAFDDNSAIDILNEGQQKVLDHFVAQGVHIYNDLFNTFTFLNVPYGSLGFAIAVANLNLKPAYNGHLAASYPLNFGSWYPFQIGQITDRTHLSISTSLFPQVYPALTPYTYFADLHMTMNSNLLPITVTATVTSDDSGSVTNPGDYTGSIVARAANSPAQFISDTQVVDFSSTITLDREIVFDGPSVAILVKPDGMPLEPTRVSVSASLQGLTWAFNQLAFAYSMHILNFADWNAGHQNVDLTNTAVYITSPTLAGAIESVNAFVERLNAHMSSDVYHFQSDFDLIRYPVASDMDTLVALVAQIRQKFLAHNIKLGVHSYPGWRIYSARLFDQVTIRTGGMVEGTDYTFSLRSRDFYCDNALGDLTPGNGVGVTGGRRLGQNFYHPVNIDVSVEGVATRPSLASALPRPGIVEDADGIHLESDAVDVFFSKPMYQVPLDPSNIVLTGGTISVKDMSWKDPQTASVRVSGMATISYSLQAVGLTDSAGNPIYP